MKFRIKKWDDMVKEFRITKNGNIILTSGCWFINEMRGLCGKRFKGEIIGDRIEFSQKSKNKVVRITGSDWTIDIDMLIRIKEEIKMINKIYKAWKDGRLDEFVVNDLCEYIYDDAYFSKGKTLDILAFHKKEDVDITDIYIEHNSGRIRSKYIDLEATIKLIKEENKMETIKIINNDFSVLLKLRSINYYGLDTEIFEINSDVVRIGVYLDKENKEGEMIGYKHWLFIPIVRFERDYIKEELKRLGFNIEFVDVEIIDTYEKLFNFIVKNRLVFYPIGNVFFLKETNVYYEEVEIEDLYNVEMDILNKRK